MAILSYRAAVNKDIPKVKEIIYSVLKEYNLQPDDSNVDHCLNDLEGNYHQRNGFFGIVLNTERREIGTFGLYAIDDTTAEIRKMYLLPAARGKGLGKSMVTLLINKAREMGYSRLYLDTASVLKEAIGLYQKMGFKEVSSDHIPDRCDKAFELYL